MRDGVAATQHQSVTKLEVGRVVVFQRGFSRCSDRRCIADEIVANVPYTVLAMDAEFVAYAGPDDAYPKFYPRLDFEALCAMARLGRLQPDRPREPVAVPARATDEHPFEIGPVV